MQDSARDKDKEQLEGIFGVVDSPRHFMTTATRSARRWRQALAEAGVQVRKGSGFDEGSIRHGLGGPRCICQVDFNCDWPGQRGQAGVECNLRSCSLRHLGYRKLRRLLRRCSMHSQLLVTAKLYAFSFALTSEPY